MRGLAAAAACLMTGAMLSGCAVSSGGGPVPAAHPVHPPHAMQWLYGSAESAVAARQVYAQVTAFGQAAAASRPILSVILADGAGPDTPRFEPCGTKPLAAVFDADETLIWNVGPQRIFGQRNIDFDKAIWGQWEQDDKGQTRAMPGAVEMVSALRAAGIAVYVISNRSTASDAPTAATLRRLGFGEFVPGDTLLLMPEGATSSSKDSRRAKVAATHCVVLMGGDQLGDFSQAFNAEPAAGRMASTEQPGIKGLWGRGWFLFSNPVYGPWDKYDDAATFPAIDWSPKEGAN